MDLASRGARIRPMVQPRTTSVPIGKRPACPSAPLRRPSLVGRIPDCPPTRLSVIMCSSGRRCSCGLWPYYTPTLAAGWTQPPHGQLHTPAPAITATVTTVPTLLSVPGCACASVCVRAAVCVSVCTTVFLHAYVFLIGVEHCTRFCMCKTVERLGHFGSSGIPSESLGKTYHSVFIRTW